MNSTLTFTAGSYYRTRNGKKAIVYAVYTPSEAHKFCIHGAFWDNRRDPHPYAQTWASNGQLYSMAHDLDLVAPWFEPVEFDVTVVPPWMDTVSPGYDNGCPCWFAGATGTGLLRIPPGYAPKNAKSHAIYRIDREKGVLVEL